WRIDDITLNGNILCVQPEVFSVTGGGTYCQSNPSGVPIGVSGSQTGISYQLKRNGTNVDSPIAGNGSSISFLNQTTAGTYTVVGTITTCSLSATMAGSVTVAVDSSPVAGNFTPSATSVCSGSKSTVLTLNDQTGTVQ